MTGSLNAETRAAIGQAKRRCAKRPEPFRSDAELLDEASTLFELRGALGRIDDEATYRETGALAKRYAGHLHRRIGLSPDKLRISGTFSRCRLSRLEREIMLVLALSAVGMREEVSRAGSLARELGMRGKRALAVVLAVGAGSRLERHGLVKLEGGDQGRVREGRQGDGRPRVRFAQRACVAHLRHDSAKLTPYLRQYMMVSGTCCQRGS